MSHFLAYAFNVNVNGKLKWRLVETTCVIKKIEWRRAFPAFPSANVDTYICDVLRFLIPYLPSGSTC